MRAWMAAGLIAWAGQAWAGEISATVADADGKPVEDAVVFVYETPGKTFPAPAADAVMDQVNMEFLPHVLPVLVGTKIRFPNKDNIHHHIYSFSKAKKFEAPLYKGTDADPVLLDKPGIVKLGCNIHDWMLGYVLVLDNPYYARTGADGKAVIANVPAGDYEIAAWSERFKGEVEETKKAAKVGAAPAKLKFALKVSPKRKSTRPAVSNY